MSESVADSRRQSVGVVAVQLGLITQQQLMDCVHLQSGELSDQTIDQILISKGYLKTEQVDRILDELSRRSTGSVQAPTSNKVTRSTKARREGTASQKKAPEACAPVPGTVERPTRATAVRKPPTGDVPQPQQGRGTAAVRREGTTAKRVASPRERATAVIIKDPPKPRSAAFVWSMAIGLALVPILGAGALYVMGRRGPTVPGIASHSPVPTRTPAPPVGIPHDPRVRADDGRIRAELPMLAGDEPFIARWNDLAARLASAREPEQYRPFLGDLERIVTESRGSRHEDRIATAYRDVIDAMTRRAEQVFAFINDEVARLSAAGKFGDAVKSWDWFPLHLDPAGIYAKRIETRRAETLDTARTTYGKLKAEADGLVASGRLPDAKNALLRALEIGLPELVDDAYQSLSRLTDLEDAEARKAEEAQLAEFEKAKKAERESAGLIAALRRTFWDLVTARNLEGAAGLLQRERAGATAEVVRELDQLDRTLQSVRAGFEPVAAWLDRQAGRTLTLAFLEGGLARPRAMELAGVRNGTLKYRFEGRDFTALVTDLASPEIMKVGEALEGPGRALVLGLGRALAGDFHLAYDDLKAAGAPAAALLAFVEGSSAFLERNAGALKSGALQLMEAKEWEKAVSAWTRLAALPTERKEALRHRARAHYQLNNFVAAVLDIESLFEMDVFTEEVIDLLNSSYRRATLIAKAIQIYETASARVPENAQVLANLVALYMQIHEFKKAEETLKRAEKLKTYDPRLFGMIHLLHASLEPAFAGKFYSAKLGRYDLETNVSQEYANDMVRFMTKVYDEYVKVFPYKKNETLRFKVKLFASESEFFGYYRKMTGATPAGPFGKVLAYYMPLTKELVGWNAPDILETLMHEGLHQYIDYFVQDCPIWFNEGYASYFEKSTAAEARFNPGRHMTARYLLETKELPTLKELFLMTHAEFRKWGAHHYGSSWSAIYWLHKSGQRHILDRYFEALMAGKTQEQAYDEVFGPGKANVDALDAKWRRAIFTENYEEK